MVGKICPGCGEKFVGIGLCCTPSCGVRLAKAKKAAAAQTDGKEESKEVVDYAIDGTCPTCGQTIKPPPMTNAERQRRFRERQSK